MTDEILVKGTDGKWYLLKGEELVPYGEPAQISAAQKFQSGKELPKGVDEERHERLEVAKVASVTPPSPPLPKGGKEWGHAEHPVAKELEEIVDGVVREVKEAWKQGNMGTMWDDALWKRFRNIVSARLRDVRDSTETQAMLTRDQKVGGMGLSEGLGARGQGLDQVMSLIEKAFGEFQRKWKEAEEKRKQEWRRKQEEEKARREEEQRKKEAEEIEKRYQKIAPQRVPQPKPKPAAQPPIPSRPPTTPPKPSVVIQPIPRPYTIAPSPSGKITDVRTVPKQLGPVEELGSLTLEDFRRIPGTLEEKVRKIVAKPDILGQESPARRVKAIAALRASPLYERYGAVLNLAMTSHISPEDAIIKIAGEGKQALTKEEFYAIMELNQKLRF